jgi:hypothetical protein
LRTPHEWVGGDGREDSGGPTLRMAASSGVGGMADATETVDETSSWSRVMQRADEGDESGGGEPSAVDVRIRTAAGRDVQLHLPSPVDAESLSFQATSQAYKNH